MASTAPSGSICLQLKVASPLVLANLAPAFTLTIERESGRHRVFGLRCAQPAPAALSRADRAGKGVWLDAGASLHYALMPPAWPGGAACAALSLAAPELPCERSLREGLRRAMASPPSPGGAPVSLALAQLVFCFPAHYADAASAGSAACSTLPRLRARLFQEGASLTEVIRRQRAMRILFAPASERTSETARRLGVRSSDGVEVICREVTGVPLAVVRRAACSARLLSSSFRNLS